MWNETRVRRDEKRREKSAGKQATHKAPQATAEQLRLAQLVVDQKDDDAQLSKNISKIVEVTGVSEENALLALYDSNDDPSRAVELLLEKEAMGGDGGWEMAGRRKHRGGSSITRGNDDDEIKEQTAEKTKPERSDTVGKGRGRKGRDFDRTKTREDNDKENLQSGKERHSGRGRSRSGPNRGRGRGAPRHHKNCILGGKSNENSASFDSMKDSLQGPVDVWKGPNVDCWDIEVGTWSSKDVQKSQDVQKTNNMESWGTESWTDDLSESRVFQAQKQVTVDSSGTSDGGRTILNSNPLSGTMPQTGERIDLRELFKKPDLRISAMESTPGYGGHVNSSELLPQHESSERIQEFQQHGQVKSRFNEGGTSPVTSRLFTDYEQPQRNTQPKAESLFESNNATDMLDSSYPQLNGNASLHNQAKDTSSFLKSFSGLASNTGQESQSDILGQLSSLTGKRTEMYSQLGIPISSDQAVLRRTTAHSQSPASITNLGNMPNNRDEEHLSFGSPLPPQVSQQSRQQRKKLPPLTSKIPASAVEMPGNKGYNTHFSLQFGIDDLAATDTSSTSLDYVTGTGVSHTVPSNIMMQPSDLFLNSGGKKSMNSHQSPGNADSLFSQTSQRTTAKSELHKLDETIGMSGDHTVKAPPGLNIPTSTSSALSSLSPTVTTNHITSSQQGSGFLPHSMSEVGGRSHESSFHKASSSKPTISQNVMYYVSSTSSHLKQGQNMQHGANSSGFSESLQGSSLSHNSPAHGPSSESESAAMLENTVPGSHSTNISSLAASLSQVSIQQSLTGQNHPRSSGPVASHSIIQSSASSSYSPAMSTSEKQGSPGLNLTSNSRKAGYDAVHNSSLSSSYNNNVHTQAPATDSAVESAVKQTSAFKMSGASTVTSTALGGFATAKMPQVMSNKGSGSLPSGVTTHIPYGIPMMPYNPDIPYAYDQLLLAQSRVVNPLNFYDMQFHSSTQTAPVDGQDSSIPISQALVGRGKYNRGDSSSPSPSQLTLSGSVGAELTQHNASVPLQPVPPKASQSSGLHTGQQQYVGAMPAYANYSSLAAPYYSLGMANAGFQYPATMFAAAMHQAPKHAVNTADGFQQQSTRFNHTSTAITSSSGLSDLSRPNYAKTHPTALEKQQGYHQHTNTPPPFNLQAITAAVATGGAAATGSGAPGLGPYAPPYMALLQPHHASQQQAMHLLPHQHQDATSSHSVGSQRNLGSSSLIKSANKHGGYGSATSSYWGT